MKAGIRKAGMKEEEGRHEGRHEGRQRKVGRRQVEKGRRGDQDGPCRGPPTVASGCLGPTSPCGGRRGSRGASDASERPAWTADAPTQRGG